MSQLDTTFAQARRESRGVLIPYLTGGFPDPDRFVDLALAVLDAGADALEIGIPFSDPLLDGPTIQASQQRSLDSGVTPDDCLKYAAQIHLQNPKPLLFMGAYNPMLAYGLEQFCIDAAQAGACGLIVPDLPFEEQADLLAAAGERNMDLIQIVAPTSTGARLKRACRKASGFVYCVSVAGVTGARTDISDTARPLVERVRACTDTPIAVGFGIAGPEQARDVARYADGVIVGSALINLLAHTSGEAQLDEARGFIGSLRAALDPAAQNS